MLRYVPHSIGVATIETVKNKMWAWHFSLLLDWFC